MKFGKNNLRNMDWQETKNRNRFVNKIKYFFLKDVLCFMDILRSSDKMTEIGVRL